MSDYNKKLYVETALILCNDLKKISIGVIIKSTEILSKSYETTKNTMIYCSEQIKLMKKDLLDGIKYNIDDGSVILNPVYNNLNDNIENDENNETDYKVKFFNNDKNDNHDNNKAKDFPDVIIDLNKTDDSIKKIWIVQSDGGKNPVRGKLNAYPFVQTIIMKWFNYEQREKLKWYPQIKLYTEYRNADKMLDPMTSILFKYKNNKYTVYKNI